MFGWFKKKTYKVNFTLNVPKSVSGISEPVISIVNSFSEKGRWKVKRLDSKPYHSGCYFTAEDTKTGEVYNLFSTRSVNIHQYLWSWDGWLSFPVDIKPYSLPSWMTSDEKEYVVTAFKVITEDVINRFKVIGDRVRGKDEKQAKVNQHKERQRLVDIYCNGEK